MYNVFEYTDEEMHSDYFLISNKSGNGYLVPEHKKADYLLMKKGEQMEDEAEQIMTKLRAMNNVILVYEIKASELRSKQHLIF